jgi:hypothetical protein
MHGLFPGSALLVANTSGVSLRFLYPSVQREIEKESEKREYTKSATALCAFSELSLCGRLGEEVYARRNTAAHGHGLRG